MMCKLHKGFFAYLFLITLMLGSQSVLCADDHVILLHGLGRSASSMKPLARRLTYEEDYKVSIIGYPSTQYSIEKLSREYVAPKVRPLLDSLGPDDRLFFVTHSMGGIILRYMMSNDLVRCDGVVMLCPPNQGSVLAATLRERLSWLFLETNGPAGQQLGNRDSGIFMELSPLEECSVGIIAFPVDSGTR